MKTKIFIFFIFTLINNIIFSANINITNSTKQSLVVNLIYHKKDNSLRYPFNLRLTLQKNYAPVKVVIVNTHMKERGCIKPLIEISFTEFDSATLIFEKNIDTVEDFNKKLTELNILETICPPVKDIIFEYAYENEDLVYDIVTDDTGKSYAKMVSKL